MLNRTSTSLLLLTVAFLSPAYVAQTNVNGEAPLQVIRFSWREYRPSRLSLATGVPRAEAGPTDRLDDIRLQRLIAAERRRAPQDREASVEKLEERQVQRQRQLPNPSKEPTPARVAAHGNEYSYSVELKNLADKKVQAVEWDYVFVEAGTGKELRRHSFRNDVGIGVGKRKKVEVKSATGPHAVVDVNVLSGESAGERVEIKRVIYSDGTKWERK